MRAPFSSRLYQDRPRAEGDGSYARDGLSKPKFGGNGNKSRFGGGSPIRYGEGFRQNQMKEKDPTTGLEHVFL